jgi:NAD(P)-dependent dehydrogenase (short-subunit alcohol dehydrogenase family)
LAGRHASALERGRRSLNEPDQCRAITAPMDVTSIESIAAAQQALIARLGRVDVLVNNAAVLLGENDYPFSIAAADYRRTFETNLFGVITTSVTSAASLPACPAYADVSEKIVSRKPLGSLTSNARLFHSVS